MSERYHLSPDQGSFADMLGKSLLSILPLSRLRAAQQEDAATWAALTELGVFEVSISEARGGSGLGATEEALLALELGRRVAAPSVFATLAAAHLCPSLGCRVAAGYRRGERTIVIEDEAATMLLVRSECGAELFERPNLLRVLEPRLWSNQLLEAGPLGAASARARPTQVLRLRLIDAAALAGLARAALEMAVAYAGLREQFGRPIGTFQAVKHHCANMALAARSAGDQVCFAALALDDARPDVEREIDSALFVAGSAAIENCAKNIQIHGGIGFSDEADPARLLKRARVLVEIAGGLEATLARVADCPQSVE